MAQEHQGTLAFDNLDIDLIIKVATHTVFSPFFTFFIPIIYKGAGAPWSAPTVYVSSAWFILVTCIWAFGYLVNMWRNSGTPGRLDWGEQIIVITGGSSGIGALLANTLAVRHCTVVVLDIHPIETENHNITYYKCDVSNWEEVKAVAKLITEELGEPTVIVNNAGVVQGKLIVDLSDEDVKQTFGVNVIAHFNTLRAFLPGIVAAKEGHIVTVASILGQLGSAQVADYCASKAALISLHDCLRQELDFQYNAPLVRTTLLTPGLIQTPMFSGQKPLRTAGLLPGWLFDFLIPPIPPHTIVKAIIAALDEQESRDIILPFLAHLGSFKSTFPYWIYYYIQRVIGTGYVMNGFKKTTGKRVDEQEGRSKDD